MSFFRKEPESAKKKSDYKIGEIVGKGAYGVVREALQLSTKRRVAIKVIEKSILAKERKSMDVIQKEFDILSSVKHPNVIQFLDWFETKDKFYLVYELASGGEMFKRVVSMGHFSERECVLVVATILNAIVYLHSHNLVHRDLKPENLLYRDTSEDSSIVIVDFGVAKLVTESEGNLCRTFTGSAAYMAPEVIKRQKYGKAVDVWSVGVITFVLLSGHSPWGDRLSASEVYRAIEAGKTNFPSVIWDRISPAAQDFVRSLMNVDPEARPTAHEALHHPWLEKLCPKGYIEYIERHNVQAWTKEGFKIPEHVIPQWSHVSADPRTGSTIVRGATPVPGTPAPGTPLSAVSPTTIANVLAAPAAEPGKQAVAANPPAGPPPPSAPAVPASPKAGEQADHPLSPAPKRPLGHSPLAQPPISASPEPRVATAAVAGRAAQPSMAPPPPGPSTAPSSVQPPAPSSSKPTLHSLKIRFATPILSRTPSPSDPGTPGTPGTPIDEERRYEGVSFGKIMGRQRRMSLKGGEVNLFQEAIDRGATYGLGGSDEEVEVGGDVRRPEDEEGEWEDLNAAATDAEPRPAS